MAKSKKEILYWFSVFLYGVILVGLLLYLRFPTEKFRKYCERYVENSIPEVACTIGKVQYGFPLKILFEDVELKSITSNKELLYSDPLLTVMPFWKNPAHIFSIKSAAFGGSHVATIEFSQEAKRVELRDMKISGINLAEIGLIRSRFGRKITGNLGITGSVTVSRKEFKIVTATGLISVNGGDFELKKPILEQSNIGLDESTAKFDIKNNILELTEGKVKGKKLGAAFRGKVSLAEPLLSGSVELTGDIVPLEPLYQEKKQLKAIVTRMQKRYKKSSLPFNVGGTVGRPTFVFGK